MFSFAVRLRACSTIVDIRSDGQMNSAHVGPTLVAMVVAQP